MNISVVISLLGLIGGFTSWIYIWASNRVKLSVSVLAHKKGFHNTLLFMSFANESRLPIAITNISLKIDDKFIDCTPVRKLAYAIKKTTGDTVTSEEKFYSESMPINLPFLSATSVLISFPTDQDICSTDAKVVTVEICTNRNKTLRKTVQLPDYHLF